MAATKSSANERISRAKPPVESPREITNDIVDYLIEYSRERPGYAALFCVGVGFVLGWKLKPW